MSDQRAVALHLRKKADEKKTTARLIPLVSATNRAIPIVPAINRAIPIVPGVNTAHPSVPDIQALNSIARAANVRKSSVTAANHDINNDSPIKTTRVTVDPRTFSDSAANSTLQSTANNAVVLYAAQQTLSPMEMIQHETVRTLQSLLDDAQAQLSTANTRCEQLSAENKDLRRQISDGGQEGEQAETPGILSETLVGYDSLGEAEDDIVSSDPSAQSQLSANERLDTVTQILELQNATQAELKNTIAKQAAQIDALQNRVEEDQKRQPPELKEAVSAADFRQLVVRIANLENGPSASKNASSQHLTMLQARMELKERQYERIDDAVIREELLSFYETLSEQIAGIDNVNDGFKGTEDDLWAWRDRVLCRLAIFELYGQAVEEAKAAMEYNGKGKGSQGSMGGGVSKSAW